MASPYKTELDQIVWSFSTLHLYETCPYAFYLYKIENNKGISNFYAENGAAMHQVFQKLCNREIGLDQAPTEYLDCYKDIVRQVRKNTMDNIFNACLDYLCICDDSYLQRYDVVWVEKKLQFKIGRRRFTGFVDLLLRDKASGDLVLVDHKSIDPFFKKSGGVLKNQQENFAAYSHQMYIYCHAIFKEFGKFPTKIVWHHFKKNGELSVIDFSAADYEATLEWAKKLIRAIYRDKRFTDKQSYMQCRELCNYRNECVYRTRGHYE